jgi:hypothetical protein
MTTTRFDNSLSRRSAIAGIGASGLGLAATTMASRASAQEASPAPMDVHPIVGTWVLEFEGAPTQPAFPAVTVFGADGSFIDAANGHAGVWEATGETSALHTWVHVFPGNYVVVSGTIEVDTSGDTWMQQYTVMVVSPDGTVVNQMDASVHARRLRPVPQDQMGAPLEVVPTWTPPPATPET